MSHKIQPGETLASIAQRYGTTVEILKELNPITLRYVYAGMTLKLPATASARVESAEVQPEVETQVAETREVEQTAQQPRPVITQQSVEAVRQAIGDMGTVEVIESQVPIQQNILSMQLNYSIFTHANASTIRNSSGRIINGIGEQSVIVRGNDLHITDHTLHLHTILLPQKGIVYIYSDVMKRGLQIKYDYFVSLYMSGLARREASGGYETREYQLTKGGTKKKDQHTCTVYSGHITTPSQQATVNLWETKEYGTSSTLRYLLDGIDVTGVPVRFVIERRGLTAYALNMGSIAAELKSVERRNVSDEEMLPSSDIRISIASNANEANILWQDNLNYLKKNEMYPDDAEVESAVRYSIDDEWDL